MQLRELRADRLRNLSRVRLELGPGLHLLTGNNGQGKTSLLEAVFLLAAARSFRTRDLGELIRWGKDEVASVSGSVEDGATAYRLAVELSAQGRRLAVSGEETDLEGFLGRLPTIDLTATRAGVITGPPEDRRRFLDRGLAGLDAAYLRVLAEHRRVLEQRNALLRSTGRFAASELDAWDERLAAAVAAVHARRREYLARLDSRLDTVLEPVFPRFGRLELRYRPSPSELEGVAVDTLATAARAALARSRPRDVEQGHTTIGPHRDDVEIVLDGIDLRRYGSAGQVRAAMVGLKLGKMMLLQQERGTSPLFLMDDFDTDLDEERAASLAAYLDHGGFQSLAATSKEGLAGRLGVAVSVIRVEQGFAGPR